MKIKRFEAPSMPEALRKIKKEFGEEAVILSAKTVKKSSLLGMSKNSRVIVTAAVDKAPVSNSPKQIDVHVHPAPDENEAADESKSSGGINILKHFKPITLTGQKKVKPKIVQLMNAGQERVENRQFFDLLVSKGFSHEKASELECKAAELLPQHEASDQDYLSALARIFEAEGLVATAGNKNQSKPRFMVMIGPSGVGKTSVAAKLCTRHTVELQQSVALISFDNQRVAGTAELERYARILGVPLHTIFDSDDVNPVMKKVDGADLVIVDTPGLCPDDQIMCEKLRRLMSALPEPEPYLLINAEAQEKVMARIIDLCRPLGIQKLIFTKLDWAADMGPMINRLMDARLPVAYLSDSSKVHEGMQAATGRDLARRIIAPDIDRRTLADDSTVTVVQAQDRDQGEAYYVANQNSDIFHLNNCKAVKRISTGNMVVFKDPAEALGRQFKPCRMCCSELIFPKPIDRLARGYAGHRWYYQQ